MDEKPPLSARERWGNLFDALCEDALTTEESLSDGDTEEIKLSMLSRLVQDPRSNVVAVDLPDVFKSPPPPAKEVLPTGDMLPNTESRPGDEPPLNRRPS